MTGCGSRHTTVTWLRSARAAATPTWLPTSSTTSPGINKELFPGAKP